MTSCCSPLHIAIGKRIGLGGVRILYEKYPRAIVHLDGGGRLPLHHAAERSTPDVVKFLLDKFKDAACPGRVPGQFVPSAAPCGRPRGRVEASRAPAREGVAAGDLREEPYGSNSLAGGARVRMARPGHPGGPHQRAAQVIQYGGLRTVGSLCRPRNEAYSDPGKVGVREVKIHSHIRDEFTSHVQWKTIACLSTRRE
jgi:Ankyrin repeat